MHVLVEGLRTADLDLRALHYGDGGPPAGMFVRGPGFERLIVGSYETGISENDNNQAAWNLPNVVVAVAR